MDLMRDIGEMHEELTAWRRDLHEHPETAFEEHRTSDFIAEKLSGFGLDVHRGLAGTGVVATLTRGTSGRAIALRADMDALLLQEENDFAHRSRNDGKMHACGHDGHSTMLLGAARYLSRNRRFDGTVRFIFQPAEETGDEECGGNRMVRDGLFERFPVTGIAGALRTHRPARIASRSSTPDHAAVVTPGPWVVRERGRMHDRNDPQAGTCRVETDGL